MAKQNPQPEEFDIFVQLPSGSTSPVMVRYDTTIWQLKIKIEFTFGVPVDMQNLSYKHNLLIHDDAMLRTCIIIPGVSITVDYPYGWEELIEASLVGHTKSVINDIYHHFDKSIIARRRSIAMFISSHKGYGFLVDRMLSDGANPNTQTLSGRTALHISSAMGMCNCIDMLLQHNAFLDIQDTIGLTPQELAARCRQWEAERKLHLFRQIKRKWDDKSTKRHLQWPLATHFHPTKLGQSVTPIIDLQQLSIRPGPEDINCVYPLPGQCPRRSAISCWTTTNDDNVGSDYEVRHITHGIEKNSSSMSSSLTPSAAEDISINDFQPRIASHEITIQMGKKFSPTEKNTCKSHLLSDDQLEKYCKSIADETMYISVDDQQRIRKAVQPRFISAKESFQMKYGKKRTTEEENKCAFQQWLTSKQQDTKDKRLIKKVKTILNNIYGVEEEEKKDKYKEQPIHLSKDKVFDDWLNKKVKAEKHKRQNQLKKNKEKDKLVRQGKTFNEWIKEKRKTKVPSQTECRIVASDEKRQEAQLVFEQWLMNKQCEELERLKADLRPRSAMPLTVKTNNRKIHKTNVAQPEEMIRKPKHNHKT